jgi:hypothetical protein
MLHTSALLQPDRQTAHMELVDVLGCGATKLQTTPKHSHPMCRASKKHTCTEISHVAYGILCCVYIYLICTIRGSIALSHRISCLYFGHIKCSCRCLECGFAHDIAWPPRRQLQLYNNSNNEMDTQLSCNCCWLTRGLAHSKSRTLYGHDFVVKMLLADPRIDPS